MDGGRLDRRLSSIEAAEFEFGVAEIDEQSYVDSGGVQVVNDDGLVFGSEGPCDLEFDEDLPFDENVDPIIAHVFSAEGDAHRVLLLGSNSLLS